MEEAEAIRRVAGALLTAGGAIGVGIGVGLITAKYLEGCLLYTSDAADE